MLHDPARLIGTIDGARAQHCLPAGGDTSGRSEDIIPSVAFVHLHTLEYRVGLLVVVYDCAVVEQTKAVVRHAVYHRRASAVDAVHEIGVAVVVPEGARVFPFGHLEHLGKLPGAARVGGTGYKESVIGCAEIYVIHAVVIAQGGSP